MKTRGKTEVPPRETLAPGRDRPSSGTGTGGAGGRRNRLKGTRVVKAEPSTWSCPLLCPLSVPLDSRTHLHCLTD